MIEGISSRPKARALLTQLGEEGLRQAGCIPWAGSVTRTGYGPHRELWVYFYGPVPDGLKLDHFLYPEACMGPGCVNPTHCRPATQRENLLRGNTIVAELLAREECVRGHAFTPENTHVRASGKRDCLTCRRAYDRARRPAKKAS